MNKIEEINRLNLEDYIFITFIVLAILNIYGDNLLKKYIKENKEIYQQKANEIFLIVIIITILIYIYFFYRNYKIFKNADYNKKHITSIKLLGSFLLLVGGFCLLYFQLEESNFIGAPDL